MNVAQLLQEYHDALVKTDELNLLLGSMLHQTRVEWDETATCDGMLKPLEDIAERINKTIPQAIKNTRSGRNA